MNHSCAASLHQTELLLFFTGGMSLRYWEQTGVLERELALYRALRPHLGGITLVTYGDRRDLAFAGQLGDIRVVCNRWGLPPRAYSWLLGPLLRATRPGPAIVKTNQAYGADVALRVARQAGWPAIARCGYLHADFVERQHGANSPAARSARRLEQAVFAGASRVVVTTPAMRADVIERYALEPGRVRVVPNYVETEHFRPAEPRRAARRVGFVGRLTAQKNLAALLEAMGGLDAELVLVGQGEQREQLQVQASRLGLPAQFVGIVPHQRLPELLNSFDVFVLPSHYEGHPKVLLEAMSCGLAVVGADAPGIRELICHRETGLLCGGSADDLRAAIATILDDDHLRRSMGQNARAFALERFALGRVAEQELALLGELAGPGDGRPE